MSAFLDGLGKVFGKVAEQFQSRLERLKNERLSLLNEREKLLHGGQWDEKKSARLEYINNRLNIIDGMLANKASDD